MYQPQLQQPYPQQNYYPPPPPYPAAPGGANYGCDGRYPCGAQTAGYYYQPQPPPQPQVIYQQQQRQERDNGWSDCWLYALLGACFSCLLTEACCDDGNGCCMFLPICLPGRGFRRPW